MFIDKTVSQLPMKETIEPTHVLYSIGIELGSDNSDKLTMQLPTEKLNSLILHRIIFI